MMRLKVLLSVIGLGIVLSTPIATKAQSLPKVGPPFQELETLWNGFWEAIRSGDLKGAAKYIHSRRQHVIPLQKESLGSLQELARQMAYCRLESVPLIFTIMSEEELRRISPGDLEKAGIDNDLIYRVRCEHQGEKAETQIGVRKDVDGVWRISLL